jgi:hypothetical protein
MMDRIHAYISHPLGEDSRNGTMRDNIAHMGDWIRYFISITDYVLMAPWYVYAITLTELIHAPRRLVDSMAAIERCDVVIQCGGYLSPHMANYEAKAAKRVGTPIADLTSLGVLPPDPSDDNAVLVINRIERAIVARPRRVWMPLLTADDIDQLKKARHALHAHLPGEHDAGVALLDRILTAAHEK